MRRRTPVNEDDRKVTDPERSRKRTMDRAVRLLAAKPRSVLELKTRLLEKLWTDESIVDAVIEKLKEYKYLDDDQFARDLAASKLRQKAQGRLKLRQSMANKQLDRQTLDAAINDAFEKMPEADLLDRAIEKRLRLKGRPETREEVKKFYDHLMRLGFSYGMIRDKVNDLPNGIK